MFPIYTKKNFKRDQNRTSRTNEIRQEEPIKIESPADKPQPIVINDSAIDEPLPVTTGIFESCFNQESDDLENGSSISSLKTNMANGRAKKLRRVMGDGEETMTTNSTDVDEDEQEEDEEAMLAVIRGIGSSASAFRGRKRPYAVSVAGAGRALDLRDDDDERSDRPASRDDDKEDGSFDYSNASPVSSTSAHEHSMLAGGVLISLPVPPNRFC